jgi:hypothetical protein
MKSILNVAFGLLTTQNAFAMRDSRLSLTRRNIFTTPNQVNLPSVPGYNCTMPVDHFNDSNTDTYLNPYFVNDTYYHPGGPVILFDFGEAGVSTYDLAIYLAEWNGTDSTAMRLAAKLNGVVIGWEHRYYGYSQPTSMDVDRNAP